MHRHLLISLFCSSALTGCGSLIQSIDDGIEEFNKTLEDVNAVDEENTAPADLNKPQVAQQGATPAAAKQPTANPDKLQQAPATTVNARQYRDAALYAYHAESKIDVTALAHRMARWETGRGDVPRNALNARKAELERRIPGEIKRANAIPHYTLDFPVTFVRYDKYKHYYYFTYDNNGASVFDYNYGFMVGNPKQFSYVEVAPDTKSQFDQAIAAGKPMVKARFTVATAKTREVGSRMINAVVVRVKEANMFVNGTKLIEVSDDDAYY